MKNANASKALFILETAGSILLGLVFLGLGIMMLLNPKEYEYTADAVISSIEVVGGEWVIGADDTMEYQETYAVSVDYTFKGQEIKGAALDSYSSSMKVGDSIEIQFNEDELMNVSQTGFNFLPIAFIVAGIAAVVLGLFEIRKFSRGRF